MRKFLNSVIPFSAVLPKLFNKPIEEVRDDLKDNFRVECSGLIPGATEIPLEKMLEAGFSVRFFLKDNSNSATDLLESGIIIMSVQHENPKDATIIDGLTFKFDPISEIEISTLSSAIVNATVPEAFGPNYEIEDLFKGSSEKIQSLKDEAEVNKKIRDAKTALYEANPELARKHAKKAIDKIKFKSQQLAKKSNLKAEEAEKLHLTMVQTMGDLFGITNAKSFEDLKEVPEIKEAIASSKDFGEILEKMSKLAEQRK